MLGRRAAGAGLEQATAAQQGHDGEHLGAGAQFDDGEQVGQVVAQHVAGDGDGVLARADALAGDLHGLHRREDPDVQATGVMVLQIGLHLGDDLGIVGPVLVKPEDGGGAGDPGAGDGQLDPILDRGVLGLAHPEDVSGLDLLMKLDHTRGVHHPDRPLSRRHEGLIVAAVFLGLLRHEADVGHTADGGGVEMAVLLAVLDDGLIDRRVAAVRDHGEGVVELAVRAPHLPGITDDDGHGSIDDDVVGHVQVRDALVGIHHRQGGVRLVDGLDVGLDLRSLCFRQLLDLRQQVAQAVVQVHAEHLDHGGVLGEHVLVEDGNRMAEHDGIGDLHHGGLEVQRQQQAFLPGRLDLGSVEGPQGFDIHHRGIDDFTVQQGGLLLEDHDGAVLAHELDPDAGGLGDRGGGLAAVEVTAGHVGHPGLRFMTPGTHLVGVLLGIVLHGEGGAAV